MNDDARKGAILDAATGVFLRYGFKKTSMEDLARAAGLSRQGLYLHFATKEELFKAGVLRILQSVRQAGRTVLTSELPLDEKLLEFFLATHAHLLGAEHMTELMEAATQFVGHAADELEAEQSAHVAKLLRQSAAAWKLPAADLAAHLFAASHGIKLKVNDREEYRRRMRVAVKLVCR